MEWLARRDVVCSRSPSHSKGEKDSIVLVGGLWDLSTSSAPARRFPQATSPSISVIESAETTASFLPEAQLSELFPTPLLQYQWPDSDSLNAELREVILAKMREESSQSSWLGSNIGGWRSPKSLHTWPHPCVANLSARIETLVRGMVARVVDCPDERHLRGWSFDAWANVSYRDVRTASHIHDHMKNTIWSGIYYVDSGENTSQPSGVTKFEDRCGVPKEVIRNPDPFEREISILPRPGLMVLFSSRLWHRVEPFHGPGSRITIAFNVSHPGFVVPSYPEPKNSSRGAEQNGLRGWMWRNFRGLMFPLRIVKRSVQRWGVSS
jgi:uncharacterized protein (TIGR02466 family)